MIGMSEDKKNVEPMRLTAAVAQKRIRELAQRSTNLVWGTHIFERMEERELFDVDVLRILRGGYVEEAPEQTERGEWKCKITLKIRGTRTAGVVVIFLQLGKLFLKTVEWEDLK